MVEISNSDWKLFRIKLAEWQENYMAKVNVKLLKLLQDSEKVPSEKFWAVEKLIFKEKKNPGVIAENVSRSNMFYIIIDLLNHKVIKTEDLTDFSEEFRERIDRFTKD